MMTATEQVNCIHYCENNSENLNEWERQFIENISLQLARCEMITVSQVNKLEEIHNKILESNNAAEKPF